jgi:peroxiredoxin
MNRSFRWTLLLALFCLLLGSALALTACAGDDDDDEEDRRSNDNSVDDDDDDDATVDDDDDDDDFDWNAIKCPENRDDYVLCINDENICGFDVGMTMYNFSLKDAAGDCFEAYDYAGDVVLFDSFAVWCPGCVEGTPILQGSFHNQYKDDGFTVLQLMGGDIGNGTPDNLELQEWVDDFDLTFPVLADPFYSAGGGYNQTNSIPFYWLVDQNMTIVAKIDYNFPPAAGQPRTLFGFHTLIRDLLY